MSMKLTDLMKLKGRKIEGRMGGATPDRFGKGAAEVVDKKEQRRRDQEAGLVPFAVKLHGDLIKRLHALAQERHVSLNELTAELINAGLGSAPAPSPAAAPAEKKAEPKKTAAEPAVAPAVKAPAKESAKPKAKPAADAAPPATAKTTATKKSAAKPAAKPAGKKK